VKIHGFVIKIYLSVFLNWSFPHAGGAWPLVSIYWPGDSHRVQEISCAFNIFVLF